MTKQVNVFAENKPGRLKKVTEILFHAGINIRAMEIQDRGEFGVMKLLVDDPEKANLALSDEGLATALKDVLAVVIEDKPGGLYKLAEVFEREQINMVDAYGFVVESASEAIWCVDVDDVDRTRRILETNGFRCLSETELYEL